MTPLEALQDAYSLTPRQAECLALIMSSIRRRGLPPTYRQLAERLGIGCTRVVQLLAVLERKGAITREPGAARAVVPRMRMWTR